MKFRRQVPVGRFIADFACVEERIVVEVDGGQHAAKRTKDLERFKELAARGYRVLRFWNNDVLQNLSGVLTKIIAASYGKHPLTPTLSQREREGPAPTLSAGSPAAKGTEGESREVGPLPEGPEGEGGTRGAGG